MATYSMHNISCLLYTSEYNYIMTNSLWDTTGQQKFVADSTISMPAGPTGFGPIGAMEFKAAWKVIGKGDDASRFYTIKAIVYNDDAEAVSYTHLDVYKRQV